MQLPFSKSPSAKGDDLVHVIGSRLGLLGCHVRSLWIFTDEGGLVLQGRVRSYYSKQMAQQVAREMSSLLIVTNEIEVDEPGTEEPGPQF